MAESVELVTITGHSGAGKSEAIAAFEDGGYFCVDNLPPRMIGSLGELFRHEGSGVERAAVVSDVRGGEYFDDLVQVLDELETDGLRPTLLFLEADEETLLDRYKETRRRHPLAPEGSVSEGIRLERAALTDLREIADQVIDTSVLNVHDLKRLVSRRFTTGEGARLGVTVVSFGFRYGIPAHADLVLDVRFLPNPYFVPELKLLTGEDPRVASYVLERSETQEFLDRFVDLAQFLFPRYQREGKAYLTVALGCTGGKHRSVAVAAALAQRLGAGRPDVQLQHRDIEKE